MNINDIYMRDPFVFVEDGVCYLLGTTDKQAWGGKAFGFLGYKSTDMVNFEGPYELFRQDDNFWADEQYWAPEMHKIDGKYYIFASFHKEGKHRASQVLISDSPLGKYKATRKPFTPSEWDCLDATYWEEKGKRYAIFCHEWTQIHDGEMCVGELNEDFTELSNIKTIFKASDAKWVSSHTPGSDPLNYITDGPFVYKTKSGSLLLLWSSCCKDGYALGIARSTNGIYGPYEQMEKPLFSKDGGHGMIFSFNNKKYVIIHTNNALSLQERPLVQEIVEKDDMIYIK